jgi:UDP-glucose 4-epimerase
MQPGRFQPVNLGTGRGHSVLEVIEAARTVTGRPIEFEKKPRREGDPPELVAGGDRAKRLLGWTPRHVDLVETVRHAWNWLEAHPRGYGGK